MIVSENVYKRMSSGSIRRWFEEGARLKKQFGEENVFDFSLGNPVNEPPAEFFKLINDHICNAKPGSHGYMQNAGYAETRASIAKQLSKESSVNFSENDVIMTVGAAGGLNVILKSILNPGEEVIVFTPFFTEFDNYINNHNGVIKLIPTDDSFLPRLDLLEKAVTKNTKALILNSPNNPTGVVYSRDFIVAITDLLKKKCAELNIHVILINDEAYRKLIYDNVKYTHVYSYYPDTITVNSHSKDLALAGQRIGYITIHPDCSSHDDLVSAMIFCNRILGFVNAPAIMQAVIKDLQHITVDIDEYRRKRDFLYDNLTAMGYRIIKPQGAFYMFPQTPIPDDDAFVADLRKHNILTVPGSGFGTPGYFRIAYCVKDSVIERALPGFEEVAMQYNMNK